MTEKLRELSEREESNVTSGGTPPPLPGAAAWVVQGMELEVNQYAKYCDSYILYLTMVKTAFEE